MPAAPHEGIAEMRGLRLVPLLLAVAALPGCVVAEVGPPYSPHYAAPPAAYVAPARPYYGPPSYRQGYRPYRAPYRPDYRW
jgi:hypothetical protein